MIRTGQLRSGIVVAGMLAACMVPAVAYRVPAAVGAGLGSLAASRGRIARPTTAAARLYSAKQRLPTALHMSATVPTAEGSETAGADKEEKPAVRKRILSGVQPTGNLHLGNYLGAIRQWVANQDEYENFFCVVDLHAITAPHVPAELTKSSFDIAALYLAAGIDPAKSKVFIQSHVSAHAELCWLLNCVTPMGWMEKMIQYKEKAKKQGESVSIGLFDYPILMAADILLYQAQLVPVGEDQRQHLELARDIARRFNDQYCKKKSMPAKVCPTRNTAFPASCEAGFGQVENLEDGSDSKGLTACAGSTCLPGA